MGYFTYSAENLELKIRTAYLGGIAKLKESDAAARVEAGTEARGGRRRGTRR